MPGDCPWIFTSNLYLDLIYPKANKVIPFSRHEVHIETKYGLLFTNGKISVVSISLPITRMKWSGDSLVDANWWCNRVSGSCIWVGKEVWNESHKKGKNLLPKTGPNGIAFVTWISKLYKSKLIVRPHFPQIRFTQNWMARILRSLQGFQFRGNFGRSKNTIFFWKKYRICCIAKSKTVWQN